MPVTDCRSLVSSTPFLIRRDWLPAMEARRRQDSWRRHVVRCRACRSAVDGRVCRQRRPESGLTVLDQHNAVFKVPARLAANQSNPVLKALLHS